MVIKSLTQEVEQAQNRFKNAGPDHIGIAAYDLLVAEERLNQYIREQKKRPSGTAIPQEPIRKLS